MKHGEDKLQKKIEGALNSAEILLIMSGSGRRGKYDAKKYWENLVIYHDAIICRDSIGCSMDVALNLYGLLGEDNKLKSDVRNLGLKQILWGLLNSKGSGEIKFNTVLFSSYHYGKYAQDSDERKMLDALNMLTGQGELSDHIITAIAELEEYLEIEKFPHYIQDIILSSPQNIKCNDFVVAGDSDNQGECLTLDSA